MSFYDGANRNAYIRPFTNGVQIVAERENDSTNMEITLTRGSNRKIEMGTDQGQGGPYITMYGSNGYINAECDRFTIDGTLVVPSGKDFYLNGDIYASGLQGWTGVINGISDSSGNYWGDITVTNGIITDWSGWN